MLFSLKQYRLVRRIYSVFYLLFILAVNFVIDNLIINLLLLIPFIWLFLYIFVQLQEKIDDTSLISALEKEDVEHTINNVDSKKLHTIINTFATKSRKKVTLNNNRYLFITKLRPFSYGTALLLLYDENTRTVFVKVKHIAYDNKKRIEYDLTMFKKNYKNE